MTKKAERSKSGEMTVKPDEVARTPDSFRKAVEAVHIAPKRGAISLNQQRMYNALIKNAVQQSTAAPDLEIEEFKIPVLDLMRDVGMDRSNNRDYLKETARSLIGTVVDWNYADQGKGKGNVYVASGLLASAEIDSTYLRYTFSKQLRSVLMRPAVYATIDMQILRMFKRGHTVTLWENVIRYKNIGVTKRFDVDTLRDMFVGQDSDKGSYQEYKIFKRAVLRPALLEINALTDQVVELHEFKVGRSIREVQFTITQKVGGPLLDVDPKLLAGMIEIGIGAPKARTLINLYGYERAQGALVLLQARLSKAGLAPIENVTAYFEKAAAEGWAAQHIEVQAEPPTANEKPVVAMTAEDVRLRIKASRIPDAENYFIKNQDQEEMRALIDKYNAQQSVTRWRVSTSKKPTDGARKAFYLWLAEALYGEPTDDEIVEYLSSQQHVAAKVNP